ncbi:transcriptional regulator [Pseudomonas fluorescens]|uniref:Transcriptional regulator n=1 Tax=Pseudomonas fluorescens TaxID=294 RepID=A0A379IEW3_PSEFL|nr:helix-turn-helix domain-containing protein [Pseudomonas fluorescens]SUD31332.1 transcriptional regulator [Pseudomonas fluorescens]
MQKEETQPPRDDARQGCKLIGIVLDRIGDKWTVMTVAALSNGPLRFNALMRSVSSVSHRMLTLTLRGLERDGMVKRTIYPTTSPKVEYELTEMGCSLIEPLQALGKWAAVHGPLIEKAQDQYDRKALALKADRESSRAC